jgi:hypothetical protein
MLPIGGAAQQSSEIAKSGRHPPPSPPQRRHLLQLPLYLCQPRARVGRLLPRLIDDGGAGLGDKIGVAQARGDAAQLLLNLDGVWWVCWGGGVCLGRRAPRVHAFGQEHNCS